MGINNVLRLPPYNCIVNPIELIWSQLKHMLRTSNRSPTLSGNVLHLIGEKTQKIDRKLWQNCVKHVEKIEESFSKQTDMEDITINVRDNDDNDETYTE